MSNDLSVPLKVGETYFVCDVLGMIGFKGVYHGVIEQDDYPYKRLLLFKKTEKYGYPWAGVEADTYPTRDGIVVNLTARYYGKTPTTLKLWNAPTQERKPKWVRGKR
jgi:hypothetical protein